MHRLALLLLAATTLNAQWQIQDSHTTASLRGIHALGNGIAWASGTNGTVLRTTDDGTTWQTCTIRPDAEKLDFRGIQAFDANTAVVMSSGKGDLSRLYKTTDGCQTWHLLFTNPDKDGFWDALVFNLQEPTHPSSDWKAHARGFLVGDPVDGKFVIYSSNDSGQTWHGWSNDKLERPASAAKGESLFAASNSAAVATGTYENLAFVTGGIGGSHLFLLDLHDPFDAGRWLSFTKTGLAMPNGDSSGAFSVAARSVGKPESRENDFMVVGGDYQHPDAAGSAIFLPARNYCCFGLIPQMTKQATTPPHGYRSSVAYDPTQKLWITVGPNGTDISTDDGKNWHALTPTKEDSGDADKNWNALSLPFVVGPKGRIGKLRPAALRPEVTKSK
jgi:hypothetical protein